MTERVVVFVDWQNLYNRCRDCFHDRSDSATCGQVNPTQLGHLLARKRSGRELKQVRVYRGIPTQKNDPKGYAAVRRQTTAWMKSGGDRLHVTLHPLQYLPGKAPREKGIDVELAIDMAMMAVRGEYDVGVLVSADTDLRPAVNAVYDENGSDRPWVEIAGCRGLNAQRRIAATPPRRAAGLWLEQSDYDGIRDTTDYNLGK